MRFFTREWAAGELSVTAHPSRIGEYWPSFRRLARTLSIVEAFQKNFNQDLVAGDWLEDSVCGEETLGTIVDAFTTTTLELVLRDAAGDPVPDAAYEVCFGERPIERGQLDAEGFAHSPGFPPHAWFLDSTE